MKHTLKRDNFQNEQRAILTNFPYVVDIIALLDKHHAKVFLVGGAARDYILGISCKDLDIEVHGLDLDSLEEILMQFGNVIAVGKSFGVLRIEGLNVDWSVPRVDSVGRKPSVVLHRQLSYEEAFGRRDLTINAFGLNLVSGEIVDPFNGLEDLKNGILRAPCPEKFSEDPLRLYRVMQFVGRFGYKPDKDLDYICSSMDVTQVSSERIEMELEKLLLRSDQPSRGFRWLRSINRLHDIFPEIAALVGVQQEPEWHPEGDVFEHSMQVVDAAASIVQLYEDNELKLVMLYASLCHDFGKAITTRIINNRIVSYSHELAGIPLVRKFLKRIMNRSSRIKAIEKLVRYHMLPAAFVKQNASLAAYKRLASKLAPDASLKLLADLALADYRGRNSNDNVPLTHDSLDVQKFLFCAQSASVENFPVAPLLQGRDIINIVESGPKMGKILECAYQLQIEQNITDKSVLYELIKTMFCKNCV